VTVEVGPEDLRISGQTVPLSSIRGFAERYDLLTGRGWLHVEGTTHRIPMDEAYGNIRAALRQVAPDQPFTSDWMDGRFPGQPLGLPQGLVWMIAIVIAGGAAWSAGQTLGIMAGLALVLAAAWPLGRLRDGWVVRPEGIRGGPPWAPIVPWFDVDSIHVVHGRRRVWVYTRGQSGGHLASLPRVLLPAFRARVRRLGGLELQDGEPGTEDQYLRWRAPAFGIPWGIGFGTLVAAPLTPLPWTSLVAGASAMTATALLGMMVAFRAGGWGTGSVAAGTLLYAFVVLVLSLAASPWVGGS
jgi:hypothetical protein